MRLHTELELGFNAQCGHYLGEARSGELALNARSALISSPYQRVRGGDAIHDPAKVQGLRAQVNLCPHDRPILPGHIPQSQCFTLAYLLMVGGSRNAVLMFFFEFVKPAPELPSFGCRK